MTVASYIYFYPQASQAKSVYKGEFKTLPYVVESDVGATLALKKSHFVIGEDDPKRYYQSMYKRDNIEYKDIAPSRLEESLKNDLRRHHWGLGTPRKLSIIIRKRSRTKDQSCQGLLCKNGNPQGHKGGNAPSETKK